MCAVAAIPLAIMAVGALAKANAAKEQSKANRAAAEHEAAIEMQRAHINEQQARQAEKRGQQQLFSHRLKVGQLKGAQRARFAAAGLDLNEGSALNVLLDTDYLGEMDARTIKENTDAEAAALRAGKDVHQYNSGFLTARAQSEDPGGAYRSSLMGSAGTIASSWYGYGTRQNLSARESSA